MPSAIDYEPKALPFNDGLTGISEKTITIHHDKLYAGYVAKMKEIATKLKAIYDRPEALALANQSYSELRALKADETFAANGVYLHEAYFDVLGGNGVASGELADALAQKWGSVEKFIAAMSAVAMSVRGWAVLAWDANLNRLKIYGADSHNQGGVWGAIPLIVLDVYEHSYFIDFGSDRKAYIEAFWKNLNWAEADKKFQKINRTNS